MITYNVTIKLEKEIETQWVTWMREEHMPALFDTGCFHSYALHKLLQDDATDDGVTYIAQYHCNDLNEYQTYIDKYASEMRNAAFEKFGNRFIAFRTLMEKQF